MWWRGCRPGWRFGPEIAQRIEALAWWDWDHERLQAALPDFRSLGPEAFVKKFAGSHAQGFQVRSLSSAELRFIAATSISLAEGAG